MEELMEEPPPPHSHISNNDAKEKKRELGTFPPSGLERIKIEVGEEELSVSVSINSFKHGSMTL